MFKRNVMQFVNLSLFRTRPDEMLYSYAIFGTTLLLNFIIFFYTMSNLFGFFAGSILACVFITMLNIYVGLSLKAYKLQTRFMQTASSLLGSNALITFLGLMLGEMFLLFVNQNIAPDFFIILSRVMMTILFLWSLGVCSYIFKYVLDKSWLVAFINALVMLFFANLATWLVLFFFARHAAVME